MIPDFVFEAIRATEGSHVDLTRAVLILASWDADSANLVLYEEGTFIQHPTKGKLNLG